VSLSPERTVAELRELQELTGDENGAQRVAWTETWERARQWLREKVVPTGAEEEVDEAGNQWFTLPGASERALLLGGHIDSVPNGGWLDGSLNVVAAVEVLRRIAEEGTPPLTVRLVNWADEEGARFGRSLFGSSAAAGSMSDQDELRERRDAEGIALPDALAGAARLELELREITKRIGGGAVCTMGGVVTKPGIVTSVVETAECLLDQRHLDATWLAEMLSNAEAASRKFAHEEGLEVSWEKIWSIEPIPFDDRLLDLAEESVREVAGSSHRLPSGPLHDAAEVSRAGIPTVMLFVQSLRGLSHTRLEDTKEEHLELSVQALDRLTTKALEAFA